MVADECHPALGRVGRTPGSLGHVPPHRPRRNLDSNLQQEFIGDPFLSPGRIVRYHIGDQFPQLGGNARSTAWP